MTLSIIVLALVTAQRLGELVLARHNTRRLLAQGAVETGSSHYVFIVILHAAWLLGLLVALAAAGAGFVIHLAIPAVPWLTVALVLGVITGCVPRARAALDGALRPGLAVASRRLLRIGIVLLGLKLSLEAIAALGWVSIVGIVVLVLLSFGLTWLVAKAFRLEGDQPLLLAAGFSICGV